MSADTSGPAFPADEWRDSTDPLDRNPVKHLGMTLRDYFAAKALQAFMSGHIAHYGHENHWPYAGLASEAYKLADAMLKARNP